MPHVNIKIVGRTEAEKATLAQAITKTVVAATGCAIDAVSVSIEDVEKSRWVADVYRPDILGQWDKLYKKPGYDPL